MLASMPVCSAHSVPYHRHGALHAERGTVGLRCTCHTAVNDVSADVTKACISRLVTGSRLGFGLAGPFRRSR